MKKQYLITAVVLSLLLATGCDAKNAEPRAPEIIVETPDGSIITKDDDDDEIIEMEAEQDLSSRETGKQEKIAYDKEMDIYDLSAEEIKAFEDFQKNFDIKIFKDLEPLSIAKIWIYSGIVNAWESEFEMFGQNSLETAFLNEEIGAYEPYTKNMHYNLTMGDLEAQKSRIEAGDTDPLTKIKLAELMLSGLGDATWSEDETDENGIERGHLSFLDGNEEPISIHFEKQNDIWLLRYYPMGS